MFELHAKQITVDHEIKSKGVWGEGEVQKKLPPKLHPHPQKTTATRY
jgi:hypothetical protein